METRRIVTSKTPGAQNGRQFVEPAEFIAQILSRRPLQRCDDPGAAVRGLLDPATGRRIFVNAESLLEAVRVAR